MAYPESLGNSEGSRVLTVHSFYIVASREGFPLYSRKWTKSSIDTALLSGFLASLEHMAEHVASQHVNIVNMRNRRFFFRVDEKNGLLLVFITDPGESPSRYRKYLTLLNKRFVEMYPEQLEGISRHIIPDTTLFRSFDEFIDDLVITWAMGEATLASAKVMDVLEVFTLFFNSLLQKFLTPELRKAHWSKIESIFQENIAAMPSLQPLRVDSNGVVYFDKIDPSQIRYLKLRKTLFSLFHNLVSFIRKTLRRRTYQSLVFEHLSPIFKSEHDRIKAYALTEKLVMDIL